LICVKKIDADFILRGLRNPADFELKAIAHTQAFVSNRNRILAYSSKNILHQLSIVRDVLATVVNTKN
jgi:pantetheine-phosphate adenylyltransferase